MAARYEVSISKIYKKHIKLIIALICIIMLSIFFLFLINLNRNYKDSSTVNMLGRQRMLTQMMAKNTGRIYTLNSVINDDSYSADEKEDFQQKLLQTIKELNSSKDDYKNQYNNIKQGYIVVEGKKVEFKGALKELKPILSAHDALWKNFDKSINTIINEKGNTPEVLESVKYINESNDKLLKYSDDITNIVLDYIYITSLRIYYGIIVLIVLILAVLAVFIINAYKNLFRPISQLYKGMEKMGITTDSIDIEENSDLVPVFSEVNMIFDQLNSLKALIENLNKNIPFKYILKYIFDSFSKYIPYTHIGIALIDDEGKNIKTSYGISDKRHKNLVSRLRKVEVYLESTSLFNVIKAGNERIINDLEEYVKGKPLRDYNRILLEEGIRSSITFPLKNNDKVIGIIFFSSNVKNVYTKEHIKFLRILANSIVFSIEKDILTQDMVISSTLALAQLTEERDPETGEHLDRMKMYSRMIAEFLSKEDKYKNIIDADYINDIERFSPLHDIGKVAIRDEILLKPGKLTLEEFQIMKTHAVYGAKVLKTADENLKKRGRSIFKMAIEIAEGHHEKWDGSGYPYGRKGEDIPLSARIVALADVFDALTSKRPYKEPFSFETSINIITEGKGKHFDPHIIDVFIKNLNKVREEYLRLNEHVEAINS